MKNSRCSQCGNFYILIAILYTKYLMAKKSNTSDSVTLSQIYFNKPKFREITYILHLNKLRYC